MRLTHGQTVWQPGLIDDYARFHDLATATGDVDPVYPVLRRLGRNYPPHSLAWMCFLHVAYYDLGSALRAASLMLAGQWVPELLTLPCGTERRGHRDPRVLKRHLEALVALDAHHEGLDRFVTSASGYGDLFGKALSIWGNGRWAAYKTCELLASVFGRPELAPTDMGHAHSSGPRAGLALLFRGPLPYGHSAAAVRRLNVVSGMLVDELWRRDLLATQPTTETTLCDFHSLHAGRYYVGHDIDQMGGQLRRAMKAIGIDAGGAAKSTEEAVLLLRASAAGAVLFPFRWPYDVDKARRRVYRETGEIIDPR